MEEEAGIGMRRGGVTNRCRYVLCEKMDAAGRCSRSLLPSAGAFCARRWTRLVDARVRCCHGEDGEAWWLRRDGAGSRRWWRRKKEMVTPPLLREWRKMVVARGAAGREGCCCRWFCSCVFRRGGGGRRGWRRRLPWKVEEEEKIRVRVLGDEDDDVAAFHWTAC
ncbi:hypothetical protein DEO72_LG6g687 [Vigna unguiculata]|uniref:Uncharacterized protein n=1 Tax=Vigna unguiculata TaxID=3917 RepID=A0A4D6M773_VIGUN|nr:hypothetical protein DEO72_LG6g687 [Vigna unguiculata]